MKSFLTSSKTAQKAGLRICMLAYTFYENDNRVLRYAESLRERGDTVEVIALRREGQARSERVNGVRVSRIQRRNYRSGLASYLFTLSSFLMLSAILIFLRQLRNRYDVIHVHSVPDFLVFSALPAKLFQTKILLDIHDITPELFLAKVRKPGGAFVFRILLLLERISCAIADYVIVANHIWQKQIEERTGCGHKCSTILNYPDPQIFNFQVRPREDGIPTIVYPGTMSWHQGVALLLESVARLSHQGFPVRLLIYGEGTDLNEMVALSNTLGIQDRVSFRPPVPIRNVPEIMRQATCAVEPKRSDGFAGNALSTKILEFMALGVPVAASDTNAHRYYFDETLIRFFDSGDSEALANTLSSLLRDRQSQELQVRRALDFISRNNWEVKKDEYFSIVDRISINCLPILQLK